MADEKQEPGTANETLAPETKPSEVLEGTEGTQPDATSKDGDKPKDPTPEVKKEDEPNDMTPTPDPNKDVEQHELVKELEPVEETIVATKTISNVDGVMEFLERHLQAEAFLYFKQQFLI